MAGPSDNLTAVRQWLQLYTEDCVYKVVGRSYTRENSACITQMINDGRGADLIEEIKKCNSDSSSVDRRAILFALALCTKSRDKDLKISAGKTLRTISKTPRDIFTYLKLIKYLSTSRGFGKSVRKTVQKWYNQHNPMEFVKKATQFECYNGWSHRDVLRMVHVTGETDGISLILKYLVQGLEETKKEYDKPEATEEVRSLLSMVEELHQVRHSSDEHVVARLVEKHELQIEHVPTQLLNSKEVLGALMSNMHVANVLENMRHFAVSGFLDDSHKGCKDFIDLLKNENVLKKQKVQPFDVLLASEYYQHGKGSKKISWEVNPKVVTALDTAFESCIKNNVKPTNKRYLIAVRVGSNRKKTFCRGLQSLSTSHATAALAISVARKEDKVSFVYFTDKPALLSLSSDTKYQDICDEIATQVVIAETVQEQNTPNDTEEDSSKTLHSDPCDMTAPIKWALENKKQIDVFLTIVDTRDTGTSKVSDVLQQYRKEMKMSKAKHICVSLTFASPSFAKENVGGMLDIAGFDGKVPRVIQKFVSDF